jgi:hypothetical protein
VQAPPRFEPTLTVTMALAVRAVPVLEVPVPVMVSVTGLAAAALSADIVNILLVVAGLVANWAIISGDELTTLSVTAPAKPPVSAIVMVSVVLAPAATFTLVEAGVSVKPGVWDTPPLTVTRIVVVAVVLPEVPVIVRVKDPLAAVLSAVSVSTLVPVVGLGANVAVTPVGGAEAASVTLPVKAPVSATVMVSVTLLPPAVTLRLAVEGASVKPDVLPARVSTPRMLEGWVAPVMLTVSAAKKYSVEGFSPVAEKVVPVTPLAIRLLDDGVKPGVVLLKIS